MSTAIKRGTVLTGKITLISCTKSHSVSLVMYVEKLQRGINRAQDEGTLTQHEVEKRLSK